MSESKGKGSLKMTEKQIKKLQKKAERQLELAYHFVMENPKADKEKNLIIGETLGMIDTMQMLGIHLSNKSNEQIKKLRFYRQWDY